MSCNTYDQPALNIVVHSNEVQLFKDNSIKSSLFINIHACRFLHVAGRAPPQRIPGMHMRGHVKSEVRARAHAYAQQCTCMHADSEVQSEVGTRMRTGRELGSTLN